MTTNSVRTLPFVVHQAKSLMILSYMLLLPVMFLVNELELKIIL